MSVISEGRRVLSQNGIAIQVEGLTKRFGSVVALGGIDFQVPTATIFGLLGPNGAGKTTAIRILTTILTPDGGRAEILGHDVVREAEAVRYRIGLAGQFAAVDEFLTGRENVEMVGQLYNLSRDEAARRADDVLERIHLTESADRQVRTYSGGMRRRLDLAASMVGRPEVLFLDEPSSGIDPGSRLDLWDLIEELVAGGTTLLLTTQYLEEADRLADRIGVIDHGRLIDEGTSDELKDRLGGNVVEVHVGHDDRAAAAGVLTAVAGGELRVEGQSLLIPATEGAQTLTAAVRALDGAGIAPQDIGLRRPTLDDVFLALTGHTAVETTAAEPAGRRGRRR